MSDIVTFLRARLDEDEAARQKLYSFDQDDGCSELYLGNDDQLIISGRRVLREVEAKRRIVDEHLPNKADQDCRRDAGPHVYFGEESRPCLTLRLLALPYADHPDYDPAWRP